MASNRKDDAQPATALGEAEGGEARFRIPGAAGFDDQGSPEEQLLGFFRSDAMFAGALGQVARIPVETRDPLEHIARP